MERIINTAPPLCETRAGQLELLCRRYPFLTLFELGRSVLGRPIIGVRLGDCTDAVLYAGGFHAQEWLTCMLLLRFVERLCAELDAGGTISGIDCRRAMLGRGLRIVPCANPDGVTKGRTISAERGLAEGGRRGRLV